MFRSTTPSGDSFSRSMNFFVSSPSEVSYLEKENVLCEIYIILKWVHRDVIEIEIVALHFFRQ